MSGPPIRLESFQALAIRFKDKSPSNGHARPNLAVATLQKLGTKPANLGSGLWLRGSVVSSAKLPSQHHLRLVYLSICSLLQGKADTYMTGANN